MENRTNALQRLDLLNIRLHNVELDVILVELGLLELKKGVALVSEIVHLGFELEDKVIDALEVVLLKGVELLLRLKDLDELEDSPLEDIELPEDLSL